MVPADMATPPSDPKKRDLAAELEEKLSHIGQHERAHDAQALANQLNLPYLDLQGLQVDPSALKIISEDDSRSSGVALVQMNDTIGVAVTLDPQTPQALDVLKKLEQQFPNLKLAIVSAETMDAVWKRYATLKTAPTFEIGAIDVDDAALANASQSIKSINDLKEKVGIVPVTELFEILIAGALSTNSSDIHFEPESDIVRLRYRLDGLLHEVTTIDKDRYQRILNRVKVLSKMKLNITKAPQDGRFTIRQSSVAIEVRVSVLPSEYGESIVMRLLDPRGIQTKLSELGMRPDVLKKVQQLLSQPQGALLTTGPTGSGKTTTLYAFLNELNSADTKIITVEDPIEYHIKGVNQTQVDPAKGYTFAGGLRAIVRQDPDIILIGEIRDMETAGIALEAALTGHLVLSTIHANDAAGTIPRLIDLGVRADTVAPALTMTMAQRLLRRLCPSCKQKTTLAGEDQEKLKQVLEPISKQFKLPSLTDVPVYESKGCPDCGGIGYKGRIGVYEVLEVSRAMERLILEKASVTDIRDLAVKEGMVTMAQDGYMKLLEGVTSLEEIHRVLG
jgi:type II secretory ATPase GspE/PulE/Tfp pilus assembly ATPase PilB-like protein